MKTSTLFILTTLFCWGCSWLSGPEDNLPRLTVEDVKREYRIVDLWVQAHL